MRWLCTLVTWHIAVAGFAVDVIYVSVAGDKKIAVYQSHADNGELTRVGEIAMNGEPGALAVAPKRQFLFAALRSTGELAAFRIDPATGKLTHINTVPAGADPAHISVDKDGKVLLTAYYVAGQVTVHDIAADGTIRKEPRQTIKTKEKAHAIVLNPTQNAVLIPHTGPNVIYAYPWSEKKRSLEPIATVRNSPTEIATPKNTGPRHVVFHPTLVIPGGGDATAQVAYVVNEQGGSVTMHHAIFDPQQWLLTPKQTLTTLPADFQGTNACAEIRLHPSNRFLYASNRGHDSIAGFGIAKNTGELTIIGQTPTEKTPRSFDIDPSGRFLFAAGESSGRLTAYRIHQETGALARIATYNVGQKPWWVMAVRLPGN